MSVVLADWNRDPRSCSEIHLGGDACTESYVERFNRTSGMGYMITKFLVAYAKSGGFI